MNKILLIRTKQAWMAKHTGPHANEIIRLFNTSVIPTAFTAEANPTMVLAEIKRLNPKVTVEVLDLAKLEREDKEWCDRNLD
jgi:hypothetical protein